MKRPLKHAPRRTWRGLGTTASLLLALGASPGARAEDNAPPVPPPDAQKIVPKGELPGALAPYFLRAGEGERYLVGGMVASLIARGVDTGELFEAAILTGGKNANLPSHTHARAHEALLVLDGEVELSLAGKSHLLIRGDYASVPPGTPHAFTMLGHRTQIISWTTGKEAGLVYKALGSPYAGYVQPPEVDPALSKALLEKARATADIQFVPQAARKGPAQRVRNGTVPDKNVPYVLASGEGQRLVAGDQLYTFLGDQKTSDGRFIVVMTEGPPGKMIPTHYHEKHTETFFCLDGGMTMRVNGETLALAPGDFVHAPARTLHAFQLNTPYTRFVGLLTPGLFESFFRILGDPYTGHVYPQTPPPFRFDRVLSRLGELDLKFVDPPSPPK
jgi:quercetin 2,3-dioxygenase